MKYLKQLLFGVKAKGEKLPNYKLPPERPFDAKDYFDWCKEFRVSALCNRNMI